MLPLRRAQTFAELPDLPDVKAQDPLFQKYQSFIVSLRVEMPDKELSVLLQLVDEELPLWKAKKQAIYLKQSDTRRVEYDPVTELVFTHFKDQLIGEGNFGKVTQSIVVQTGQKLANKTYHKVPKVNLSAEERAEMLKEGQKHKALQNCQHVVRVYRINDNGLLLEHMGMGSLMQLLEEDYPFTDEEERTIVYGAVCGMAEIHRHGFVHKDIKLENLLVNDQGVAKLGDLGTLSVIGQPMRANRGNPLSWSPQIWASWVENKLHESRPEDDTWAMGMLLYEFEHGLYQSPSFVAILEKLLEACQARDEHYKTMKGEISNEQYRQFSKLQSEARELYQEFIELVLTFEATYDGAILIKEMLRLTPSARCTDERALSLTKKMGLNT